MNALRSIALLSLLALPACGLGYQSTNEPLDAVAIRELVPGRTTAREVVERLGGPNEVVQLGRRTAYRYDASATKSAVLFLLLINLGNQDTRQDRLWVFFDERDVLTHFGSTYGMHRVQYAMPWEDVHEAEDNAARDAGREGVGQ